MPGIFISYCRESGAIVKALADDLEALGHSAWFDHDLSGGRAWWDQILAQIRECDLFVFALSSEALTSTACTREWGYAADLGKPILPVLAADGVPTSLLPPRLSKIQFVDYRKQDRDSAFGLARALRSVPPPAPLPEPLPQAPEAPISYLGGLSERIESPVTLDYADQSALVVDLGRGLRDPETAGDARTLLARLRKRRDLFAHIAEEIDDLLPRATAPRAGKPAPETTRRAEETWAGTSPAERPEPPDTRAIEPSVPLPSLPTARPTTPRERLIGSVVGAATMILLGPGQLMMAYGFGLNISYAIVFGAGGALAGAITATNRRVFIAAAIGTFLGWTLTPVVGGSLGFYSITTVLGAVLGATIGEALRRLKKWP